MLRKVLLLFFLFLNLLAFAQAVEKTIILKDKDTDAPIEDATVTILKTKQNLLSNANGVVTFELSGNSSIQIRHSSYLGVNIRSVVLKEASTVIYLKSNVNDLEEIIVTKKHPQKILASLIENSKEKLTIPGRLKVYSREFFKLNGKYAYYNDGLMNFQLLDKSKKINAVLLVEQNRSRSLTTEDVIDDLLGYNLNDIMENYYNFKYLNPLLEAQAKREYEFVIKVYSKNKDLYVISAIPTENAKGLLDDFSVIYDPHKKLIIEVSSVVSPMVISRMKDKLSLGSRNINQSEFKTIYKIQNGNYYLLGSKEEIGFEKVCKERNKDIQVRNYFLTMNFSTQNYAYKDSEVYKDKTLYNKKDTILSDYWNESGLTATEEEQQVISSLEELNN
ncbi:carboxypeptidase-like regulatory domain-containing protein [Flavobacterium sp. CYK-4]|uniref:carboxypeptidase-like regulatory domain-containing protein n=1 Tax=Flavobacterium lotistagni TaxID=2709660 RepID=UPI00140B618C|nr:carboxypeptidase-like regulatory domain-containing protein [Flavobacterium lotistagni]NHM07138.1 carboxypeptidase-like regulatory domain-containing protein [Flavobacterium lotistagni]